MKEIFEFYLLLARKDKLLYQHAKYKHQEMK